MSKADYRRHRETRLLKGREWRQKNSAYDREWRAATPERQREYLRRRNEKDPERHRRYYRANKDKHSAGVAKWREVNREKVRSYVRKSQNKRRAQKLALPYEAIDHLIVFQRDLGVCGICGESVDPVDWHLDHIVPLARGGHHVYGNVQIAHPSCNRSKGAHMTAQPE